MNAPAFKTRSEQKIEWLGSLDRPLDEAETQELQRAIHAVYVRNSRVARAEHIEDEWGHAALKEYEQGEADTLKRIQAEARR